MVCLDNSSVIVSVLGLVAATWLDSRYFPYTWEIHYTMLLGGSIVEVDFYRLLRSML
jgi:hypothetical protein